MKEIDDNLLTEFLEGKLDEPANREIENWYDATRTSLLPLRRKMLV